EPARGPAAPVRGAPCRRARARGRRNGGWVHRRPADRGASLGACLGRPGDGVGAAGARPRPHPLPRARRPRSHAAVPSGIAVRDLCCTYADAGRPALSGVDCEVPAGTLTVVMGATGAGKTTLARCLTNIVPCFLAGEVRGDVRLEGRPIAGRRVAELAGVIGMVFQDFEAQLFSTDVTQEVVFALEQTGVPPRE